MRRGYHADGRSGLVELAFEFFQQRFFAVGGVEADGHGVVLSLAFRAFFYKQGPHPGIEQGGFAVAGFAKENREFLLCEQGAELLAFHAAAVKAVFLRFLKGVNAWVAVYFFWFGHGCVASI